MRSRSMPASSMRRARTSTISSLAGASDLAGERVHHVVQRHAAEDAVSQRLDDLAALDQRRHPDAVERPAVQLGDDHVLGHVHQPAREVAGVGGLERRVRQPLARAVGRDEVLEDRQPLAEVGGDGGLDDLARRLGHQAAHPGQLADLLAAAARAGVGHHEHRVELAFVLPLDLLEHLVRDVLGHVGPDVDDLVVALALGDQAVLVLLLDLDDLAGWPPR